MRWKTHTEAPRGAKTSMRGSPALRCTTPVMLARRAHGRPSVRCTRMLDWTSRLNAFTQRGHEPGVGVAVDICCEHSLEMAVAATGSSANRMGRLVIDMRRGSRPNRRVRIVHGLHRAARVCLSTPQTEKDETAMSRSLQWQTSDSSVWQVPDILDTMSL